MTEYLLDSSALWRIQREPDVRRLWSPAVTNRAVRSCAAQRTEFRRSARGVAEFEQMTTMFGEIYPDAPMPKNAWRWIESAQYSLATAGAVNALSPVDLLICATAAHHGLTVLHDDSDFETAARHLVDVEAQRVHR